jgi:Uncharacterized protein with conserved CXXC pairs
MGCPLVVDFEGKNLIHVSGNTCPGGEKYAKEEISNPKRILTTTVKVENREEMLSVKSSATLPKEKLLNYMKIINGITCKAPIKIGTIIIKNIDNTGVNILATKNC